MIDSSSQTTSRGKWQRKVIGTHSGIEQCNLWGEQITLNADTTMLVSSALHCYVRMPGQSNRSQERVMRCWPSCWWEHVKDRQTDSSLCQGDQEGEEMSALMTKLTFSSALSSFWTPRRIQSRAFPLSQPSLEIPSQPHQSGASLSCVIGNLRCS